MKLPEYISKAEVKRVCNEMGLRDWSILKEINVTTKEATTILKDSECKEDASAYRGFQAGD